MKLIIDSVLSEPPSSISCFRDVTLYAKCFLFEDVLLSCQKGTRSQYWKWLKRHGAHDYISYLIHEDDNEIGFTVKKTRGNLNVNYINSLNLNFIIECLRSI